MFTVCLQFVILIPPDGKRKKNATAALQEQPETSKMHSHISKVYLQIRCVSCIDICLNVMTFEPDVCNITNV